MTGVFPSVLKTTKVVPIFNKDFPVFLGKLLYKRYSP